MSPLKPLAWPSSKRHIMEVIKVDWLELKICSSTLFFGMSGRRCSRSPFRRSTGNDASGHYFHHSFFRFISFSFFVSFGFSVAPFSNKGSTPPSSPFLIEGVQFAKVNGSTQKPRFRPFSRTIGRFGAPWWPFWIFQVVLCFS